MVNSEFRGKTGGLEALDVGAGGGSTKDPQGTRGKRGKKCPEAALKNRKDLVGRFRDEKG